MFVAGIEIFFGFVAGALILGTGIVAIVKGPRLIWSGLNAVNKWAAQLHFGWRVALIFGPASLAMSLKQETLATVYGSVWFVFFFVNRVIWELRTGSPRFRKISAIAFGVLLLIIVGGITANLLTPR